MSFRRHLEAKFLLNNKKPSVITDWNSWIEDVKLPLTDSVQEYMKAGNKVHSPLHAYLYGDKKFTSLKPLSSLNMLPVSSMHSDPANYVTGFSTNSTRQSIFEMELYDHVIQNSQTILWRGHPNRQRNWLFNHSYQFSRVLVERGIGSNRQKVPGTITAYCEPDINEGALFKVAVI